MQKSNSFPATFRLRKSREFLRLRDKSTKIYATHFLILIAPSQTKVSRLGITVSSKIDKRAVVRNKIKRRIRDIFRNNRTLLREPFDIVIIARKNAGALNFDEFKQEILGALRSKRFIVKEHDSLRQKLRDNKKLN